jgi:hypothetical protein
MKCRKRKIPINIGQSAFAVKHALNDAEHQFAMLFWRKCVPPARVEEESRESRSTGARYAFYRKLFTAN